MAVHFEPTVTLNSWTLDPSSTSNYYIGSCWVLAKPKQNVWSSSCLPSLLQKSHLLYRGILWLHLQVTHRPIPAYYLTTYSLTCARVFSCILKDAIHCALVFSAFPSTLLNKPDTDFLGGGGGGCESCHAMAWHFLARLSVWFPFYLHFKSQGVLPFIFEIIL